jgi:bifunctional DNA-binding transcriptional regulator/antitoxin component of YhaV-PrlF toxin-antitoxin module
MEQKDMRVMGRCFGTAVLGPRGQLVVPVEARKELNIDTGDKLLVFGHFGGRGLTLIKVEAVEELFNIMSSQLDEIMRFVKQSRTADLGVKGKRNPTQ